MQIDVRLFAILRERAGTQTITLRLDEGACVNDALNALSEHPTVGSAVSSATLVTAVNREYRDETFVLCDGEELALIPPVSGGTRPYAVRCVRVVDTPIEPERLVALVRDPRAGAVLTFEGITREVPKLHYEAYVEMAEARIEEIAAQAVAAHDLCAIAVEHRVGTVPLSKPSVVVACSAAHRDAAFTATRYAIDRIKAEVPVWKKEVTGKDSSWVEGKLPEIDT